MDSADQPAGRRLTTAGAVVYGADQDICTWVARRIPGYTASEKARALGVVKRGRLLAGIVYDNFNGFNAEVAIATVPGSGWADRDTLHRIFAYPFHQLGCVALTVLVPLHNLESLTLATKLGFAPQCFIKYAAQDGSPLVVLQAYRDTCKWIERDGTVFQGEQGQGASRT